MKSDRKRLKAEKADLVNQMQQLYATLESREEQLRDFIRNYEQHRKVRALIGTLLLKQTQISDLKLLAMSTNLVGPTLTSDFNWLSQTLLL